MLNPIQQAALAVQSNTIPILQSDPGMAKTAAASQLGAALGFPLFGGEFVPSAAYTMPEDVGGVLALQSDGSWDRVHDNYVEQACEEPALLVIDEMGRNPSQAAFNSWLRVMQERSFGPKRLHPLTRIVATGNPDTTDSGSRPIPTALANRLVHVRFGSQDVLDPWLDYMKGGPGLCARVPVSPHWREVMAPWAEAAGKASAEASKQEELAPTVKQARVLVAGYLDRNRASSYDLPRLGGKDGKLGAVDPARASGPWPSFRSWTNAASLWATGAIELGDFDSAIGGVAGCIGEGLALSFGAWVKDLDLGDPADALADPDKFPVPTRSDRAIVFVDSVAALVLSRMEQGKDSVGAFEAGQTLFLRVAADNKDAASMAFGRVLAKRSLAKGAKLTQAVATVFGPYLQAIGFMSKGA